MNMKKNLNMLSARIARVRRWWRTIGLPSQLTILGLVVAILGLVPTYLAFFDNRGAEGSSPAAPPASAPAVAPSGVTNTSPRQPSGQGALRLDAAYNRAPESIMWATAQS